MGILRLHFIEYCGTKFKLKVNAYPCLGFQGEFQVSSAIKLDEHRRFNVKQCARPHFRSSVMPVFPCQWAFRRLVLL